MLRMSEVTTASGASHTQPLSSNEVGPWEPPGSWYPLESLDVPRFFDRRYSDLFRLGTTLGSRCWTSTWHSWLTIR